MKKSTLLLATFIFLSLPLIGQDNSGKIDFRAGGGISLLGTGDMLTFVFENELNYKLTRFFSSSLSIDLGRSNDGVFETASFTQGNFNVFISPFSNKRAIDFRLGTGLTFYNVSDAYLESAHYENGILVDMDHTFENRNSFGFNIIIESSYSLTNKVFLGIKLFTQPYFNSDINSGVMLKLGFKV